MRHIEKIVIAPGVFDILHLGHIRFLNEAKSYGNKLIVSLLSDEAVLEFKGSPPIMTFDERKELIENLRVVDMVICQQHIDIEPTLKELTDLEFKLDVLVRSKENKSRHGIDYMKSIGGCVVEIPYTTHISSTEIKGRINGKGNRMLKIGIIGSTQYIEKFHDHAEKCRKQGHIVKIPAFDDTPNLDDLGLCKHNREIIEWADQIHIIWDNRSVGTVFDFGMTFALRKPIKMVYLEDKTISGCMLKYEKESKD